MDILVDILVVVVLVVAEEAAKAINQRPFGCELYSIIVSRLYFNEKYITAISTH